MHNRHIEEFRQTGILDCRSIGSGLITGSCHVVYVFGLYFVDVFCVYFLATRFNAARRLVSIIEPHLAAI